MDDRELREAQPPRILDAITFHLQFCPLKRDYPEEKALMEDVAAAIQDYLSKNGLQERVRLLEAGRDRGDIKATSLLGSDFWPDMVLEEEGEPVAAILVKLVRVKPSGLTQAAGRALVQSYRYPWVLAFVLDKGKRRREKRELDHEFRSDMWHNRHVRFLFR